jgi:hypothetical protein
VLTQEETAEFWIQNLALLPHPEGGYYREVYRSSEHIPHEALPSRYDGDRNFGTSIYYLLKSGQFSAFHKLHSDEIWHFYSGSPVRIYILIAGQGLEIKCLGKDVAKGEQLQVLLPHGCWFAAEVMLPESFVLVGCTVHPGFSFSDFILAGGEELRNLFPGEEKLIERLAIK